MKKLILLLILAPIFGTAQSYKLVDSDYPEITMKLMENDTVNAELILSNKIIEGYVVYKQIKRLDNKNVYRYPLSFLDSKRKRIDGVMYYEPHFNVSTSAWEIYGTPNVLTIDDATTDFSGQTFSIIDNGIEKTNN